MSLLISMQRLAWEEYLIIEIVFAETNNDTPSVTFVLNTNHDE